MARRPRGRPVHGWLIVDKPAGPHLGRGRRGGEAGARRRQGRPCRHARSRRHRPARARLRRGDEDRPLRRRRAQGLPLHRALGRRHRDRRRRGRRPRHLRRAARTPDAIRAALPAFTGDILQVPPQVSAVKVDGARAYALARAGETLELAARPLHVERLELVAVPDPDTAVLEMTCGKGGYVRVDRPRPRRARSAASATSRRCAGSGPGPSPSTAPSTGPTLEAGGPALAGAAPAGRRRRSPASPSSPARPQAAERLLQRQPGAASPRALPEGATAWASRGGVPLAVGDWRGGDAAPVARLRFG